MINLLTHHTGLLKKIVLKVLLDITENKKILLNFIKLLKMLMVKWLKLKFKPDHNTLMKMLSKDVM
jgi:hypothetical protein